MKLTSNHDEVNNEDFFFCDRQEIDPKEYFCDMCGEPFAECECDYTDDDLPFEELEG